MNQNKIKIIYGCLWPEGHFGRKIANEFSELVNELSKGEIIVEITPPISDIEITEKVITREFQMSSGSSIGKYVPEFGLSYLPYLYKNFDHFQSVWSINSSISNTIIERASIKLPKIEILGYSLIGYRDIILKEKEIRFEDDFKNLIIRIDGADGPRKTFEALGCLPVYIEYYKVKESFNKNLIEAAENSPFNFIYMKWFEECKQILITKHLMLMHVEIINKQFWDSLSEKNKKIISDSIQLFISKFNFSANDEREKALELLKLNTEINITYLDSDLTEKIINKVEKIKIDFIEKYNLEKEYEKIKNY